MAEAADQYSNAKPLLGQLPSWIADPMEQRRIASYTLYEGIYWNFPQTFKLAARGTEDNPIYVPAGRVIVETLHRYLASQMTIIEDPAFGTDSDKLLAHQVMTDLLRRERIYSKFNTNKRYGIIRGDWIFYLFADPKLPAGSRVSVLTLDPAKCFPVYEPDNIDNIIGWHIAEQVTGDGTLGEKDKPYVRRLTFMKQTRLGGPSPIEVSEGLFKIDDWGGPMMKEDVQAEFPIRPLELLPSPIDDLPIYHIQNFNEPGSTWGSSEMRGLERVIAGLNQGVSDEDIALALEGLGVYTTDAGTPVDDDGNEIPWTIAPGRVVELPDGKKMDRLQGISSVEPYQKHLEYLNQWVNEATGMSDIARGRANVQVAESGIALTIELAPLLARVVEKEQVVTDVWTNLLFNLPKWLVAYEGTIFNSLMEVTRWIPAYGDKIPRNTTQEVDELLKIVEAGNIFPMSYVRTKLRDLGYSDLPAEEAVVAELDEASAKEADAFGARVQGELDSIGPLSEQE